VLNVQQPNLSQQMSFSSRTPSPEKPEQQAPQMVQQQYGLIAPEL